MKKYDSIDLAKLMGSILIFTMHCGALNDYDQLSMIPQLLARWGVPFFFICSAFFLFSKSVNGNMDKSTLRKYVYRIGMLYLAWFVFNLPNVIYQRLYSKDLSAVSTWLLFLKDSVLSSTFTGSWFLASCIFSAWFVYLLSKKLGTKAVLGITFVFYLLCVFTSAYYGALPSSMGKTLSFLCFPLNIFNGCFYFALGKTIVENKQKLILFFNKTRSVCFFIFFYLLFLFEIALTKRLNIYDSSDVAFSTAGIAVSLFFLCIQADMKLKNGLLLRKLSTIIYCCQGNVLLANGVFRKVLHFSSLAAYLASCVVAAVICVIVLMIQKSGRWKWSRFLT